MITNRQTLPEKISSCAYQPRQILQQVFGYTEFRLQQEAIIDALLRGEDCFVLMPTGGGKSFCYQIPALLREGVAIVISPLISLMHDQVSSLQANGVRAAYYNSSLDEAEARRVLGQLHRQELDLLYVAPERLLQTSFIERLQTLSIALFAIDEAHCVSQWGHDFRPEYVRLGELRLHFPQVPMIALTATADKQTRQDICLRLGLQAANIYIAGFDRPNISYSIVEKNKPLQQTLAFIKMRPDKPGIVYCMSRQRVVDVAAALVKQGISALPYHAGLPIQEREQAQRAFQADKVQVIVATIAFGMGINKPNVRFVIHYDMPKHIEGYYQETGRAGRDGLPAEALLLFCYSDAPRLKALISRNENAEQQRIELHKLAAMEAFAASLTCRRRVLLNYFGENSTQLTCNNCDICLNPPQTYDATEASRKALSCIYRVGQNFGIHHVVDVLRGADKQQIRRLRHDKLPTYGIGRDLSQETWISIIRQLIHQGYLEQDISHYAVLRLTHQARPLLRGEITLILAKPRHHVIKQAASVQANLDNELLERLKLLRKQLAETANIPPYIVFSDSSLRDMALKQPQTETEFLTVVGVGQYKLAHYGAVFLASIQAYLAEKNVAV